MTTIDPFLPGMDERPLAARRLDAANQRDSWLRQMETAQLEQMGAHQDGPGRPAEARARALAPRGLEAPGLEVPGVFSRPALGACGQPAGANAAPPRARGQHDRPGADGGSAGAPARPPAAAATLAGTIRPVAGLPTPAAPDGARAAAAPAQVATLLALASGQSGAASGAPPQEPEASPEEPAAEAPDWHKQVMHLTGDGDELQLWIRDGELGAAQSQQLVARIAADVAAAGMRLKTATINGKAARLDARALDTGEANAPATQPITLSTTEHQHVSR